MKINTLPKDQTATSAAMALNKLFAEQQGKEFLFLSSGGSSLKILDHIDTNNFGPQSTIGVLDERYSTDPEINNLAQLEKTQFLKKALANGANFIDTKPKQNESAEELAKRFEDALRKFSGEIIASVGIGPDAHTSGIMPFPEDPELFEKTFNATEHWVIAYDAQNKNPYRMRITTTFPFLRKIDHAIIFAIGDEKKTALQKLVSENGTLAESPCRIWRENPSSELFTDQTI